MSTILSSHPETSNWSAPSAPPKLHSRAREAEATCCAGVSITKSLERIEIPQCIYDSCVGLGLFSQDPIGFAGGDANLYRYVGNSPTNATDPNGLESWWQSLFGINLGDPYMNQYANQVAPSVVQPRMPSVEEVWDNTFGGEQSYGPGTSRFGSRGSIHLDDSYFRGRSIPTQVCHGMSGMGRVGPVNSFRFSDPGKIEQYIIFQEHMANMAMLAASEATALRSFLARSTVWNRIKPTQEVWPGTEIPRSFEISTQSGQQVWVHPNATEHIAERVIGANGPRMPLELGRIIQQSQLTSLEAAVNAATKNGVCTNQIIRVGGWELKFALGRKPGDLPVLFHALPLE